MTNKNMMKNYLYNHTAETIAIWKKFIRALFRDFSDKTVTTDIYMLCNERLDIGLGELLIRSQLAGLAFSVLSAQTDRRKYEALYTLVSQLKSFHELASHCMLSELSHINSALKKTRLRPVIIKGLSLWHTVYKPYERYGEDIDIFLAAKQERLDFCTLLEDLGYRFTDSQKGHYRDFIADKDTVTLPPFRVFRDFEFHSAQKEMITQANHLFGGNGNFTLQKNGKVRFRFDIDVYNTLFPGKNSAKISETMLKPDPHLSCFRRFKNHINLAYMALKYSTAIEEASLNPKVLDLSFARTIKSFGDVVFLFDKISLKEMHESKALAEQWGLSNRFEDVLNSVHYTKDVFRPQNTKTDKTDVFEKYFHVLSTL